MASIRDVAKHAGVSLATVSHVINGTKFVSEELTKKVQNAIITLGYQADPMARGMRTGRSRLIGVLTADISGLFYPYVIKGICKIASANNYSITILDSGVTYNRPADVFQTEFNCLNSLMANRVDGIIFASSVAEGQTDKFLQDLRQKAATYKQIALVSIERDFSKYGVSSVFSDNTAGAALAVNHLIDCGCKKIAHVAAPMGSQISQDRMDGYVKALKNAGHTINENMIIHGDYSHQSGYKAMETLLANTPNIDGVFAANDQMAMGVAGAIKKMGLNIPKDIKVIGFDNVFAASLVDPQLSSIHVRKKHMGERAAQMLINKIEILDKGGKAETFREELETKLIIRKSTSINPIEDWTMEE